MKTPEQATTVVDTARKHLRYTPHGSYESYQEFGATNCHGFAITSSLALSQEGIDHRIGFVNEHSTLLVPYEDKLYLLEPLVTGLRQRVDDKLVMHHHRTAAITTAWFSRYRVMMDSSFNSYLPEDIAAKMKWLDAPHPTQRSPYAMQTQKHRSLLASIFPPDLGRQTVAQYMQFKDGIIEQDAIKASDALQTMGEHFPDIDARSRILRWVARGVVKQLALNGEYDRALATTESFFSAYKISHDSRIAERQADCYRYVARYSNEASLAQLAFKLYSKALQNPKSFKESIYEKQQQCIQIVAGTNR